VRNRRTAPEKTGGAFLQNPDDGVGLLDMQPTRPIVIADDDEDDIFFAVRALKKGGVAAPVLTCANGRELIALLRGLLETPGATLPGVVFLDVKMPEMGGFEALKWIRGESRLREVAVIMLSGSSEARDTALADALGADGYLVKYPADDAMARAAVTVRNG
jgi:CheY-like chemotaxis protein